MFRITLYVALQEWEEVVYCKSKQLIYVTQKMKTSPTLMTHYYHWNTTLEVLLRRLTLQVKSRIFSCIQAYKGNNMKVYSTFLNRYQRDASLSLSYKWSSSSPCCHSLDILVVKSLPDLKADRYVHCLPNWTNQTQYCDDEIRGHCKVRRSEIKVISSAIYTWRQVWTITGLSNFKWTCGLLHS